MSTPCRRRGAGPAGRDRGPGPIRRGTALRAALRGGAALAAVLPTPVSRLAAETAGRAVAAVVPVGGGRRRALVASHLRRVYGPGVSERELARRASDAYASYARYWAESLQLPSLRAEELDAGTSIRGLEHLEVGLAGGRGVIAALPHLGGWEWAGAALAARGYALSVVVEALEPPAVFDWFVSHRRRLGLEVIPVGPGAGSACLRALAANRILCLLSDRLVGDVPGVEVELFGARTRMPAGAATLGLRTGAPVIPAAVYFGRRSDEHVAVLRPPLALRREGRFRDDVAASTQALAGELEALIRLAPTQWHLMQPQWPGDEALVGRRGPGPRGPGRPE